MPVGHLLILLLILPRTSSEQVRATDYTGYRFPPSTRQNFIKQNIGYIGNVDDDACPAGSLCAGPGKMYPLGRKPGTVLYGKFTVPQLPQEFDIIENTYYDYFNIFWRANPVGGYMNQFVPQLMLGNALANSSNFPSYIPHWIAMDSWHIGAQYFMGLCVPNPSFSDGFECDPATWVARAATGKLIAVEPGEVIETTFELVEVEGSYQWHLRIGVQGQPQRTSVVVADKPFMGLVESTSSWMEDTYEEIYVGSCLENYEMQTSENYPPFWEIEIDVWTVEKVYFWSEWHLEDRDICSWQPQSKVTSVESPTSQKAKWTAKLEESAIM